MCVCVCKDVHVCVCVSMCVCVYQEGAEHVEADEVDDGEAAPAGELLSWVVVGLGVAQLPAHARQHDVLPRLPRRTPVTTETHNAARVTSQ